MRSLLLLASEDAATLEGLERTARTAGHGTVSAPSTARLFELVHEERPDACLLSALLPGALDALGELRRLPTPPMVLFVGPTDDAGALEALRRGADDVLPEPLDAEALEAALLRVARRRGALEAEETRRREAEELAQALFEGSSAAALRLREQVQRVASTPDTTVLLLGARGTRKGLVARAVHAASDRAERPFVEVACAGRSDEALARELFGGDQPGALSRVGEGTLHLARVADLGPDLQRTLLELLETRRFRPAGGGERPFGARVIASADEDLEPRVEAGHLREDLFYRLNVLSLRVPALDERGEDVPVLAAGLLRRAARRVGRPRLQLSEAAGRALASAPWPGNLRQLEGVVEHGALLSEGDVLEPADLFHAAPAEREPEAAGLSLRAMEEATIRRVLSEVAGNRSRAARVLGINRTTLYNKLRLYGID